MPAASHPVPIPIAFANGNTVFEPTAERVTKRKPVRPSRKLSGN